MATLDEIAKEKQRIGEALARVDAQREKLAGQLSELEATERVLARYSKGPQARRAASGKTTTGAPQQRNQVVEIPAHRASAIRSLPWQRARRSRKSLPHAKAFGRTTSASR